MFARIAGQLFSFRGRMPRSAFWLNFLLVSAAFVALLIVLEQQFGRASSLVLYPPLLWILTSLAAKRLHDRGWSAWWLLVLVIPVLGPLWMFVELGLRRGTTGENHFGPDPLHRRYDYLTVS